MPRGSQGLIRGARGSQTGLTETAWRRPKLPRSCLGRLWDLSGRPPEAILEQILIPNSMIVLQTFLKPCLLKFKAKFHVFCFARPCRYTVFYNGICMFSGLDLLRNTCKICLENHGQLINISIKILLHIYIYICNIYNFQKRFSLF